MQFKLLAILSATALVAAACSPASSGRSKSDKDAEDGATTGAETTGNATGGQITGGQTTGGQTTSGETTGAETTGGQTTGGNTTGGETTGNTTGVAQVCSPGLVTCDGPAKVVACAADGSAWQTLEACTGNGACDLGTGTCKCAPSCADKNCGDDGCGGACGQCEADVACSPLGKCGGGACLAPPNGTGINVGNQIKDINWTDADGQPYNLHAACGTAPAIILMETAMW